MKNDTEVSRLHHNAFDMLYRLNNMAMQQLKINIMSARKCLIAFLCLFLNLPVYSQETGKVDNSLYMVKSEESLSDSVGKKQKNIFQKVLSYFDDSNKPKTYKKFEFQHYWWAALQHGYQTWVRTCSSGIISHKYERYNYAVFECIPFWRCYNCWFLSFRHTGQSPFPK